MSSEKYIRKADKYDKSLEALELKLDQIEIK